jgi:hypothetical protein
VNQRSALIAAAAPAAAFLFLLLPLPSSTRPMPEGDGATQTAVGAIHIHTNRSDGSGSVEEVAAAAARAGLDFIILTDHGDGTRPPDPPRYFSGVLVIDAVELSSSDGHYIAIGIQQSPFPLRGEARDIVEDVKRLGGFGIVAHPHSAKANLQWHEWDAPFDALEWLNADTEWRDEGSAQLARALLRYPFRTAETLASLLDRPNDTLAKWDDLLRRRRVVALAGLDAHARVGWRDDDANGYRSGWFVRIPSYEASLRTFTTRIEVKSPRSPDPIAGAAEILAGLKAGRVYSSIDALATPAEIHFTATDGVLTATQGETFEPHGGRFLFLARTNAPDGGTIILRQDGRSVAQAPLPLLEFESREEGTYRAEVHLQGAPGEPPIPWIVSNPIYIRPREWSAQPAKNPPAISDGQTIQGGPWHAEKDTASDARVMHADPPNGIAELSYRLGGGDRSGQYAALGISVGNALTRRSRIRFRGHASQPMRISLQARRPRSGERWQRSIYLDAEPRDVVVPFNEMRSVGRSSRLDPSLVDTILFVVDTVNTLPGSSGRFWVGDLRVER